MPTLQELQKMGAQGAIPPSGGLTLEQLKSMGAKSVSELQNNPQTKTAKESPKEPQSKFNPIKDVTGQGGPQESNGILSSIFQSTVGSKGVAGAAQLPGKTLAAVSEYAPKIGKHSAEKLNSQAADLYNSAADLLKKARTETDPKRQSLMREQAKTQIKGADTLTKSAGDISKQTDTTAKQAAGTSLNAGLTLATAGEESILSKAGVKVAKPLAAGTNDILKSTKYLRGGAQAVENAALGAGFQAGSNLQEDKPITEGMKTAALIGAAIPLGTKGLAGVKNTIQRTLGLSSEGIINRIIKPSVKDLGYGKEPARGILNEGITANSMEDLEKKITDRAEMIGQGIGTLGKTIQKKLSSSLDLTSALKPLDLAMDKAAKNNNNTLLQSLNNVKIALTHDLQRGADEDGIPSIILGEARDLTHAGYEDAVNFMKDIGAHTKWTGNPSDDKAINLATQNAQRTLREIMNNAADKADPALGKQIRNLNQRYGDLLSAKNATAHRKIIDQRKNYFDLGTKILGGGSALFSIAKGITSGNYAQAGQELLLEAIGTGTAKGLGSVAVQTRVAKFLDALGPNERQSILNSTPALRNIYQRLTGNTKPLADAPETKTLNAVKNIPDDIGTTLGISPENMAKLKTYMSLGKSAADRAGIGEDFQKLMDHIHNLPGKEGGYVNFGNKVIKEIDDATKAELMHLIDYIRGGGMVDESIEKDIQRMQSKFNIPADISSTKLADSFQDLIEKTKTR